ncbi:MAG: chorismate mutase [Oscillospiraceae bacterium]|nr:chorismate mutase [Oscillospiraceae bacterium]
MNLQDLRAEIDKIDEELIRLFGERMDISAKVAEYKRENNMPVFDAKREQEILEKIAKKVTKDRKDAIITLYKQIFELSRAEQEQILGG